MSVPRAFRPGRRERAADRPRAGGEADRPVVPDREPGAHAPAGHPAPPRAATSRRGCRPPPTQERGPVLVEVGEVGGHDDLVHRDVREPGAEEQLAQRIGGGTWRSAGPLARCPPPEPRRPRPRSAPSAACPPRSPHVGRDDANRLRRPAHLAQGGGLSRHEVEDETQQRVERAVVHGETLGVAPCFAARHQGPGPRWATATDRRRRPPPGRRGRDRLADAPVPQPTSSQRLPGGTASQSRNRGATGGSTGPRRPRRHRRPPRSCGGARGFAHGGLGQPGRPRPPAS